MSYEKLNSKGQSLVEFTIVLPIILVLILGLLEFGLILNSYITINTISRNGARLASVGASDLEINQELIIDAPNIDFNKVTVTISPNESDRLRGESVRVDILYKYNVNIPFINLIIGSEVDLKSSNSMRIE